MTTKTCKRCGDDADDPMVIETWSGYDDIDWPLCDGCYELFKKFLDGDAIDEA